VVDIFGFHLPSLAGAAAAFAAVYAAFAKFDGDQSDDNRKFVRDWLTGIKVDQQRWNKVVEELFTKFFGDKHWSWKCLRRSLALSVVLIVAVFLLWLVESGFPFAWSRYATATFVMLVASGTIADFLSLWKTRYILTRVGAFSNGFAIFATVVGDFIATTIIFYVVLLFVLTSVAIAIEAIGEPSDFDRASFTLMTLEWGKRSLTQALYAVALLTSAWLWVYLIVAYGMRALSHLPSWLKLLSKLTDFDNHPVRSIGYVAAGVSAVIVAIATLL
jgi:hypothetical protein